MLPLNLSDEAQAGPCDCAPARPGMRASDHLPLLPAILLALLPKCPLCFGAWFGVLGALGSTSWLTAVWGPPVWIGLLSCAIGALGLRGWRIRDFRPLLAGLVGASVLLAGKHSTDLPLLCMGFGILMGASLWSSWLKPSATIAGQ